METALGRRGNVNKINFKRCANAPNCPVLSCGELLHFNPTNGGGGDGGEGGAFHLI